MLVGTFDKKSQFFKYFYSDRYWTPPVIHRQKMNAEFVIFTRKSVSSIIKATIYCHIKCWLLNFICSLISTVPIGKKVHTHTPQVSNSSQYICLQNVIHELMRAIIRFCVQQKWAQKLTIVIVIKCEENLCISLSRSTGKFRRKYVRGVSWTC